LFKFDAYKKLMYYFRQTGLLLVIFFLSQNRIAAQRTNTIPAFTGYAIPLEKSNEEDESLLFSEKEGLHNWGNKSQQIHYYFYLQNTGLLQLALYIKNESSGNEIRVKLADKNFALTVPKGNQFKKIIVGSVNIASPGFYSIELHPTKKTGKTIASIQSLELSGAASLNMHFNAKPRRNAASVHLLYPLPDTTKTIGFYNEVTIPKDADQLYSYFMACGFARGYFGMQVNSATERRIIFSVWDAGGEAIDRNKVNEENKVQLNGKGEEVIAEGFGNEGTGGHSHFVYNWKAGETYKFYVTALPDSASNTTIYTGYFFIPETQKWKLIASFKAPKDAKYLTHLYSFLENFWGVNGNLYRKANFNNQWIRTEHGEWKELTEAIFSCDATGKAGDRIDFGGGAENNSFYLWNGGFQNANAKYGDVFTRAGTNQKPTVDLYKNTDSGAQAEKEKKQIFDSITAGRLDTIGTFNGVYYQILKEGDGDFANVSDTLTVNYKGWLMNGEVFDQSKEKPATFPLGRLIKGWQYGLTKCKKGGKIRLIIPSALAYSIRSRSEKIPPNSILIFDVEVLDIKK
jgi:FKBP-type peptidyl-prolyl cis-trans isomerase